MLQRLEYQNDQSLLNSFNRVDVSNTFDFLALLRRFPVKLEIPMWSAVLFKKLWYVLPYCGTCICKQCQGRYFFKEIFITEQRIQFAWKTILSLQNF